ncbi:tetraacyldisaccharide 4'-kinase [Proteobacteria bacterium 005FR1]|nr:tetraacyldisaccharide 4'-kinase [Proteobacteria bacterium 005FR1]
MWYRHRRPWLSLLLLPLSWLFAALVKTRRAYLLRQVKTESSQRRLPVPVIVVGNINLGGSGKSPLLIALARRLREAGYFPGVISRGYGSRAPFYPFEVTPDTLPLIAGDEPVMIARRSGCPVVIDSNRLNAARKLIESNRCDVILSDDGLQHYRLPRDLEIVVVDGQRGLGNGRLLPAGPLREPRSRLLEADWIVINGAANGTATELQNVLAEKCHSMRLKPAAWHRLDTDENIVAPQKPWSAGTRVHAVAGIGNPQRFFDTLRELGLEVVPHSFPDHHEFARDDFHFGDDLPVVMTEKDAVKCNALLEPEQGASDVWYLSVDSELDDRFYESLIARLASFRPATNSIPDAATVQSSR